MSSHPTRLAAAALVALAAVTGCSTEQTGSQAATPLISASTTAPQPSAGGSAAEPAAVASPGASTTSASSDPGASTAPAAVAGPLGPFVGAAGTARSRLTAADEAVQRTFKDDTAIVMRETVDAVRAVDVAAVERAVPPGVSGELRRQVMVVLSDLGAWRSSLAAFGESGLIVIRPDAKDWSRRLSEIRRELALGDDARRHLDADLAALVRLARDARVPAVSSSSRAAAETALIVGFALHPAACGDAVWVDRVTDVPPLTWVDAAGSRRIARLTLRTTQGRRYDSVWTLQQDGRAWTVRGATC